MQNDESSQEKIALSTLKEITQFIENTDKLLEYNLVSRTKAYENYFITGVVCGILSKIIDTDPRIREIAGKLSRLSESRIDFNIFHPQNSHDELIRLILSLNTLYTAIENGYVPADNEKSIIAEAFNLIAWQFWLRVYQTKELLKIFNSVLWPPHVLN